MKKVYLIKTVYIEEHDGAVTTEIYHTIEVFSSRKRAEERVEKHFKQALDSAQDQYRVPVEISTRKDDKYLDNYMAVIINAGNGHIINEIGFYITELVLNEEYGS